uniref:E2F/DP family winged-helix DNA-binding domain-containing protein n=1 Tax=Rhizophora mucronata TaxID=61149 RepID=A0A2P2K4P8_RHIMU
MREMAGAVPEVSRDSETAGKQFYCRKEKSLGVLCSNFLKLYNRDGVDLIGLDDAAIKLGVERRRIYDVVNILESVGVVARKQKNQYSWKGFAAIPQALRELKEESLKENFGASGFCSSMKDLNENENKGSSQNANGEDNSSMLSKLESKREKSLWLLTQNFVKLFLCSDMDFITLDNAAAALLGDDHNSTAMRTKVRRLYDIANVFSSLNLIEKTHHPESRKPAYRWLGWTGKPNNGSVTTSDLQVPKKRIFGTDITNTKRKRADPLVGLKSNQKENVPVGIKHNDLENDGSVDKLKQHSRHSSAGFVYGPFTPRSEATVHDSAGHNSIQDLKTLASTYYPRYQNQGIL